MDQGNIVTGQHVNAEQLDQAKRMRRRMTLEERALWQHLRANRLHGLHFRRQQVIDGFVADFYCHAVGLVVEVDGAAHKIRELEDTERDATLGARGLKVIRVRNQDVLRNIASVLERSQMQPALWTSAPNPRPLR